MWEGYSTTTRAELRYASAARLSRPGASTSKRCSPARSAQACAPTHRSRRRPPPRRRTGRRRCRRRWPAAARSPSTHPRSRTGWLRCLPPCGRTVVVTGSVRSRPDINTSPPPASRRLPARKSCRRPQGLSACVILSLRMSIAPGATSSVGLANAIFSPAFPARLAPGAAMDAVDSWQDGQDDEDADDMLTGAMPVSLLTPQLPLDDENADGGGGSATDSRSGTPQEGEEHAPLLNLPEMGDGGASLLQPSEPPVATPRDWLLERSTPRSSNEGAAGHVNDNDETETPEGLRAQVVCLRAEIRQMEREGERAQRLREDAAERKDRMVQEVLEREQSLREELASLLEEQDGAGTGASPQRGSPQRFAEGRQQQAQQRQQAQQQKEAEQAQAQEELREHNAIQHEMIGRHRRRPRAGGAGAGASHGSARPGPRPLRRRPRRLATRRGAGPRRRH
eukprot:scaffold27183_cov66-Phaeocystis_antarctica.AAC.1